MRKNTRGGRLNDEQGFNLLLSARGFQKDYKTELRELQKSNRGVLCLVK